ncbi:uncharacterized protein LOC143471426 [Clavelina lepadiformis]|uniref:uncharacterized protein LOC143471426 n=1 Tax=Clavelina lepadiformis TaxID=159417 RepID=UPI0040412196
MSSAEEELKMTTEDAGRGRGQKKKKFLVKKKRLIDGDGNMAELKRKRRGSSRRKLMEKLQTAETPVKSSKDVEDLLGASVEVVELSPDLDNDVTSANGGEQEVVFEFEEDSATGFGESGSETTHEIMNETEAKKVTDMTSQIAHALKMSQLQSQVEYQQDMKKLQGKYNLDVCLPDLPEVKTAKMATKLASKAEYQQGLKEVRNQFKGFQKLPYDELAEVKRAQKAAELSDKKYKREWEEEKSLLFYPVPLTPQYVANTSAQRNQSDHEYKRRLPQTLQSFQYDPTKTDYYKIIQDNLKIKSDKEYRAAFERSKAAGYTPLPYTSEMARFKALYSVSNYNAYTAYARKLWEHYHLVVPIPIIEKAVETAKMTSDKWYKAEFRRDCIGKSGPADIINYPQLQQAKKAAGLASQVAYRKEADKAKTIYTMPPDAPELLKAKAVADFSDSKYKKQRAQTIAEFKGFQKMDPKEHPVVQMAARSAQLLDQKSYTEDWDLDKQQVYYPVHVTPGYEAASEAMKTQSEKEYKKQFEKDKTQNVYDVTDTQRYDDMKQAEGVTSDVKYQEGYRKSRGSLTPISETPEMLISKELKPVLSKKAYCEKSKEIRQNVNVGPDGQEIAHAISSQKQVSQQAYKGDYRRNMLGKAPFDPESAYPEHEVHKQASKLVSKPEYTKDAEKTRHIHQLPPDSPEFVRAKRSALNLSDVEYKKQKKETVKKFRGFQTMDSQEHPVVQQANKAADLLSERSYKEDWEYDKQMICYPAHITAQYKAAADVKKAHSDKIYKKEFEKGKDKHQFKETDTARYKDLKELQTKSSEVLYKEEYEKNKGRNFTEIPETAEMALSKELRPVQSKKLYSEESKEMLKNVKIGPDVQEISHAVSAQELASPSPYKREYKENIVGKGPNDPAIGYPEHEHHRRASELASSTEYQKDAERALGSHTIPADAPEFVRAKESAKIASDLEYQKQRREVIDNYRGFQTMDSKEHPVVQQGIKAAELRSNAAYKEDWEYDKQNIYYPVHITPGYEAVADAQKIQSGVMYKEDFEKEKDKNRFDVTDTDHYRRMKEADKTSSDIKYKEEYEKNKGRNFTEIPETAEMALSKELRPVQSKKLYSEESKEMLKNVKIGADVQEISHAVSAQELASPSPYKREYKENIVGKGPSDPAIGYPEHEHHRRASELASSTEYQKDAERALGSYTIPAVAPEFVRAKESAKIASDLEYQKQRREVIDNYRGFQTMDSKEHPVVQQGIKAAELSSNAAYKEDWEYDKQNIYYPVHITPGYEAGADVQKIQSGVVYKEDFEKEKDKNRFDVTDTDHYRRMKEADKTSSDIKYKEEYEKNKGRNFTEIPETAEMALSKELRPVQSKKLYSEESKEMLKNVKIGADVQEISHAVSAQELASPSPYKREYKENIVGKGPSDPAIGYPEHEHHRRASELASSTEYQKDAERALGSYTIPADAPEFVRAKESAKIASDLEYQKQRREVIDNYRGFQTMDSKEHPVVQQGIKAAELSSNAAYKEDWEYDKQNIYYPVHITPGYEAGADVQKIQSGVVYKEDFEKEKDKNRFDVTDTDHYRRMKEADKTSSDIKYKEEYEKNKGRNFTEIPETAEMALSKELRPVQSKKLYSEESKEMLKNVKIGADVQEISHAVSAQELASPSPYKREYKENIVGKGPSDPAIGYPEHEHHRRASELASSTEYQKDAERALGSYTIPADAPEFVRAKESAKIASDLEYQKQRREVIDNYRGFQTMDSKEHPVVQQGIKAAELSSNAAYKEDWEYDKQNIYYPVHITPGYEAGADVQKIQSGVVYKEDFEKEKDKNRFDVTDTDHYRRMKEADKTSSDIKYKEEYEKNKGRNFTEIPETAEMALSKELRPVQSKKLYSEESKEMLKNVKIGADVQEISHAVSAQELASPSPYKREYKENIVGKGPSDPAIGYPEHEHHRRASELASSTEYQKDAERALGSYTIPADAPEFVRAKESAKIASDLEYQKQRREVIDNYRGFQTMDSKEHPVVQQGIKAAELSSNAAYKEDWEYDKQNIYYPVHITPGYEAGADVQKIQSGVVYKEDFEKEKDKNRFDVTDTDHYRRMKEADKTSSDIKYKEEYEKNKGRNFTEIPETAEMALSKELRPVQSKKLYSEESKEMLKNVKIGADVQEISHAVSAQELASPSPYKREYKENIVGKGPSDPAIGYPEHEHHRRASELASSTEYQKDAERALGSYTIPADAPEFVRAKESAKIASDLEYQKQRREVIDNYRGFQTMDSKEHPVVQQGIKAAELSSNAAYKEDWEYDKQNIYYPVHITPGYEAGADVQKIQSGVVYKEDFEKEKDKNRFDVTDTDHYRRMKEADKTSSDIKYKEEYEKNKGRNFTEIPETAEMALSKELRPVQSKKLYSEESKEMLKNVKIGADVQEISHAVSAQELASPSPYKREYKENIVGKGPSDPAIGYPEHEHHRRASELASSTEYQKDAERALGSYTIPADAPEFVRAKESAKIASDLEYQKQRREVIDNYRGFQTMDSKEHPVVQQGIKAAELSSNAAYKEDWEYDKQNIYYPVHITPGYEAGADVQKIQSGVVYKEDFEKEKDKNRFDITDTDHYRRMKEADKTSSDIKYKEEYEKNKGRNFTEIPETAEMALSKELRPVQSKKLYSEESKEMLKNVKIGADVQEISHAVSAQELASPSPYKREYKENIVGKGPSDPAIGYPEHEHHRRASELASSTEYQKDAERALGSYTIPADAPEFVRAKESAKIASDLEYQKQRREVIDNYRGFQTMDSKEHPVVQQGIKAAELSSNAAYKEDWEYDKQNIYYPVHITPGYEAGADVLKIQSGVVYKEDFEKEKDKNRFDVTDTDHYRRMKEADKTSSDIKYKEEYEKNKGRNFTEIPETAEMALSKELRPVQSKKLYSEESKEMLKNVKIGADVQEISHAVSAQELASPSPYKREYKENIVGKGPNDPAIGYPEHEHHRRASELASSTEYQKDAERALGSYTIPADAPEFVRAKESAKIASDLEYQKQRREVIDNYRGFQTMDSKEHPVVQQGIKAAELSSNAAYKEDWEYDKQNIYYPVHITPGYEAGADVQKIQSGVVYKEDFEKEKDKNRFDVTDTDHYRRMKEADKTSSDIKYKEEYEKNKGRNFTEIPETAEMALSKELRPVQSKKLYSEESKEMLKNVKIGADVQEISHAVSAQELASPSPYKREYKENIVGKGPSDPAIGYPEHEHHRRASELASSTEYQKDAERALGSYTIPADAPEFVRAKESAKIASDLEYQKQRREVIDNYRGFQTMDSKEHPVVQQGIKAAELSSNAAYKEDWEYDKQNIYYPVHITPGYEAGADVQKIQSGVVYKEDFEKEKDKNRFDVTDTDHYRTMKEADKTSSDIKYKEEYEKNKGRNFTEIPETAEMALSKELRPVQSKKLYSEESKEMLKNVKIGADVQEISHAVSAQELASPSPYKREYKENIVGKGPNDPAIGYPEHEHHRRASELASSTEYQKDAERALGSYTIPADAPEFVRAKESAKIASDLEYQKQRREVIDNYRGFQTMDSKEHPVVQQGIKAAELSSNAAYKEDWEYDKQNIYYPVHITPGYEAGADVQKIQSGVVYKEDFEKEKDKNRFDVTDTDHYRRMKEADKTSSDIKYKEEYEKNKGRNFTEIPETAEMALSKELRPVQSKKLYSEESKEMLKNVKIGADVQEISHAVSAQELASPSPYKREYKENIVGKGPNDPAIGYPEHEHHRRASELASSTEYQKDAERALGSHTIPADAPEFVRAKESAKIASDVSESVICRSFWLQVDFSNASLF